MTTHYRIGLACAIVSVACARHTGLQPADGQPPVDSPPHSRSIVTVEGIPFNTLTESEQRDGWRLLFDGKTFNGWRGLGYDTVPTAHW